MNIVRLLLLAVFIFSGTPSFAADVKLTPGFLGGKWSTEGKQGCGSATTQYVILHANGTMEVGRGDTPMSVGFWSVRDNVITLHLLVAPRESDTTNVFYQGKYHYSYNRYFSQRKKSC